MEIKTDQCISGCVETGYSLHQPANDFVNLELAPFLRGKDPLLTEGIWDQMCWTFNQREQTGLRSSGISAVDIALWDISGKALG